VRQSAGEARRIASQCRAVSAGGVIIWVGRRVPIKGVGMSQDAASEMKTRLRADLRTAMKNGSTLEAKVIRSLVGAIDNAEAPPARERQATLAQHSFRSGSAEVERLLLNSAQVRDVLLAEIHERERAAAELERLQIVDRAEALRAEVLVAERYVER
jgi:uncharacterized protein